MRRWMLIAAMVCACAVLSAQAQRGGARGFSRGVGMMRTAPSRPAFGGSPRAQFGASFHSSVHHGCPGCFHHNFHNPWFRRAFGYYGYGFGYPYYSPLLWDSSSSYSQDDQYDAERNLIRQIDELNQEVQRLREEQEQRSYSAPPAPPESAVAPEDPRRPAESRKDLPTILVFRDQHIQEVQNYAILGKELVVVADHRSRKIPLERLDLAATAKLNDERGVDFQVPR
jgi:hypothetical protein